MTSLQSGGWRWTTLVLRILLGAVFIYSAWAKLRDPWFIFANDIANYKLVHSFFWVKFIARTVPWFELLLGLWLITGLWLRASSTIAALLLCGFISLMVRAQIQHMDINCGCFGTGEKISWLTQLRDGSLLAAAVLLAAWSYLSRRRARPAITVPTPVS